MKIIHLSDLHISKDFNRKNIKRFKLVLKHVLRNSFDHMVITGDLSDNANENDYILIRQILKQYDLLDSSKTSIVIGNHDIFGGVQTAADVLNFPGKCKEIDYKQQVSNFISYFEELFIDCHFADPDKFFPYYKSLKGVDIVGLNSVSHYSKISNPMASTGKINRQQINDLKKIVEEFKTFNKPIVALIHHHFYKKNFLATSPQNNVWNKIESFTLRLRNKKKIIKVLKECGINLVLHGHSHEMMSYSRKGIQFLNAGASIENDFDAMCYYLIDIKRNDWNLELVSVPVKENLVYSQTG